MPRLEGFPAARQAAKESCWACAARMITNWFAINSVKPSYDTDQALATAWSESPNKGKDVKNPTNIDISQSAAAALADLGYKNYTFSTVIAEPGEILDDIGHGRPLLALVGTERPSNREPNLEYKGGHWVVITGINDDGTLIEVFDPDDGAKKIVPYHISEYMREGYDTQFWQHTSYFDLSD